MKTFFHLCVASLLMLGVSCQSKKSSGDDYDPYASNFGTDGGYNPYPDSGGYAAPDTSSVPQYEAPPMDEYAYQAPSPAPSTPKPAVRTTPKPAAKSASRSSRTHTVVKGDTLYGLSRRYGTTVAKIKSANGLSSDVIVIGRKLKIP